ncbi:hypothetical protein FB446DRAFT_654980, partial [Lentinula raphanica]
QGMFSFAIPIGNEVVECNQWCSCNEKTCPNRLAQRPRSVPIIIYKTAGKGWGVRSPVHVSKGTVLGEFTGTRSDADAQQEPTYVFDWDGCDHDETRHGHKYSVDATLQGNWTRFVNHSCEPNVGVYNAVYDEAIESNIPHIVFVALRDIPAQHEFGLDYYPQKAGKKTKGSRKERTCFCDAKKCRNVVF